MIRAEFAGHQSKPTLWTQRGAESLELSASADAYKPPNLSPASCAGRLARRSGESGVDR